MSARRRTPSSLKNRKVNVDGYSFNVYLESELSSRIQCRLLVPDLRGHGQTHTQDDKDLSAERQIRDVIAIYKAVFGSDCEEEPPLIGIFGHSMGVASAVHVVATNEIPNVIALVVIDVVEGSAMDASGGMRFTKCVHPAQRITVDNRISIAPVGN